jgi:hypothetical protein
MILPMYSGFVMICALIKGSSILSVFTGSGNSVGLFTVNVSPFVV